MAETVNIGMVGYKFMGRVHSNAYVSVAKFFDMGVVPVMKAVCGRNVHAARAFADQWGWQEVVRDYRKLVARDDIDVVDICTPNSSHAPIALAAAKAGKAILCEKPLAMNVREAAVMTRAVERAGVKNTVCFNYRRVPALSLARQMIKEGRIGKIYHVRAVYLQDWIMDPEFPLVWRLSRRTAGSGAHGDLAAHIIDMARFLVGEFDSVCGTFETFIKERPLPTETKGLSAKGSKKRGQVTVDDAVVFMARFSDGALGTFEATRFANGRRNGNRIEINGAKGSLVFEFERMNRLQYYCGDDPEHLRGFRDILVTEPCHPYLEGYWPPGHLIGYEHTFINTVRDFLDGLKKKKDVPPTFRDGLECQRVLDAVTVSARQKRWVKVNSIR